MVPYCRFLTILHVELHSTEISSISDARTTRMGLPSTDDTIFFSVSILLNFCNYFV